MTPPSIKDQNAAMMHGLWLRTQQCTGEGRMLADLTYMVEGLCQKLDAVEDLNKRLGKTANPPAL